VLALLADNIRAAGNCGTVGVGEAGVVTTGERSMPVAPAAEGAVGGGFVVRPLHGLVVWPSPRKFHGTGCSGTDSACE